MKLIKWLLLFFVIISSISIISIFFNTITETTQITKEEFGPKASLQKYEWFKDASEQIIKLHKDILIYENKSLLLCNSNMDRTAREQCMLWSQETAGIKSAYNDIVAEYNAASKKFNWDLYNIDNIPVTYKDN